MDNSNKDRVEELDRLIEGYYQQLTELDNTRMNIYQELNQLQQEKSTLIIQHGVTQPTPLSN